MENTFYLLGAVSILLAACICIKTFVKPMKGKNVFIRVFCILFIICCSTVLISIRYRAVKEEAEEARSVNDYEVNQVLGVEMTVDTNTATEAEYTISNNSGSYIDYGEDYEIHIQKDGIWQKVKWNKDVAYHLVGISADTGGEASYTLDWADAYGKLKPGTYRLIKRITYKEEDYWLAAEFTVED